MVVDRRLGQTCRITWSFTSQESVLPITLYSKLNLFSKALIGAVAVLQVGARRDQPFQSAAFVRSTGCLSRHPVSLPPGAIRYDGKAAKSHGFRRMSVRWSKSRGSVTRSSNPADKPAIRFNPYQHEDWRTSPSGLRAKPAGKAIPTAARRFRWARMSSRTRSDGFIRAHAESVSSCGPARWRPDDG